MSLTLCWIDDVLSVSGSGECGWFWSREFVFVGCLSVLQVSLSHFYTVWFVTLKVNISFVTDWFVIFCLWTFHFLLLWCLFYSALCFAPLSALCCSVMFASWSPSPPLVRLCKPYITLPAGYSHYSPQLVFFSVRSLCQLSSLLYQTHVPPATQSRVQTPLIHQIVKCFPFYTMSSQRFFHTTEMWDSAVVRG